MVTQTKSQTSDTISSSSRVVEDTKTGKEKYFKHQRHQIDIVLSLQRRKYLMKMSEWQQEEVRGGGGHDER